MCPAPTDQENTLGMAFGCVEPLVVGVVVLVGGVGEPEVVAACALLLVVVDYMVVAEVGECMVAFAFAYEVVLA